MNSHPKFYIASRFEHAPAVQALRDKLTAEGWHITYDWTLAGPVRDYRLPGVAEEEARGVLEADIVILLMDGGRGAHVEFGLALGAAIANPKREVCVISGNHKHLTYSPETCGFYHHPRVRRVYADTSAANAAGIAEVLVYFYATPHETAPTQAP